MSAVIANINTNVSLWDDATKLNEIRKLFAPDLTDMEFQFFVGLGKATNLNPFTREIWCVKYPAGRDGKQKPAQVFIGRDGYRKAAQSHADYDYHQCDAVYENDLFEVNNGEVKHSYKLTNRGALVGAYCIVKRHKSSRPMYVFAPFEEYSTGQSLWKAPNTRTDNYGNTISCGGKPATMIKKVAESQCLRACFQDLLGGTYGEEEMAQPQEASNLHVIKGATQTEKLKNILDDNVIDGEIDEVIEPKLIDNVGSISIPATEQQIETIDTIMLSKGFTDERREKALSYYKVDCLTDLSDAQARLFLSQLRKI